MRHTLTIVAALAALVLLSSAPPALAGVQYTAVTVTEAEGQRGQQRTAVEAWVEGEKAKIVFQDSDTPGMRGGQYVLTKDGGRTLFLVDPKEQTYAEWDLDAMLNMVGSMMESMGPIMSFEIEDVEVEDLRKEPGPELLGLPTTHTSYRTTYVMKMKMMGMRRANNVDTVQELWTTDALDDVALGVWLRQRPKTGFDEVDELLSSMQQVEGFPLKTVTRTTTTGQKGKRSTTTTSTMEVTELDRSASIPASTFEIPEGYTRSESTLPQQEGGEEGGNPLKSIFGGGR